MKTKIIAISTILMLNSIEASNYVVTLDDKHYSQSILIKDYVDISTPQPPPQAPIDPTTGRLDYILKLTDQDQTADVLNAGLLSDGVCKKVLTDSDGICQSISSSASYFQGRGTSHYFDFEFENKTVINYLEIDIAGYKNCGGTSKLRVNYKDDNGDYVYTGIDIGASGWDHVARVNLDINTTTMRLISNNGSCNASITTLYELRIY